jgi:hypothetical protein
MKARPHRRRSQLEQLAHRRWSRRYGPGRPSPAKIVIYESEPSGGLPSGFYLALFDSSGRRLGSVSSDLTTAGNGLISASVGIPGAPTAGTYVYVALLIVTQGSTKGARCTCRCPGPRCASTRAQPRRVPVGCWWGLTGQTSTPSSITLTSNTVSGTAA